MFVKRFLVPSILFLVVFGVYLGNVACCVTGGDSGDFITAIITGGIAHPPGYPLYLLLGTLFYHLPYEASPAFKIAVSSAFYSSLTVVVMFLLVRHLKKSVFLGLITALTLAFTYPFWLMAEIVEIFSLHLLIVMMLMILCIRYLQNPSSQLVIGIAFVFGLSLAHHQVIVMMLPALLFVFVDKRFQCVFHLQTFMKSVALFILGLSFYFYLPFASSKSHIQVWGAIDSLQAFFRFVFRQDYGWISTTVGLYERLLAVNSYIVYWLHELPLIIIVLAFVGMPRMYQHNRSLFLFSLLGFLFTGPVFLLFTGNILADSFTIGVYERFFLLSLPLFLVFVPFGVLQLVGATNVILKRYAPSFSNVSSLIVLVTLLVTISIALFVKNFPRANLRDVHIGEYYAQDVLASLPDGAILFSSSDNLILNVLYAQHARGIRRDVLVGSRQQIGHLIAADQVYREAYEKVATVSALTEDEKKLLAVFVNVDHRPIFSSHPVEELGDSQIGWEPYGLVYKARLEEESIVDKDAFLAMQEELFGSYHIDAMMRARDAENTTLSLLAIPTVYADAYTSVGEYMLIRYNDHASAKRFFSLALEMHPNDTLANRRLIELQERESDSGLDQ